MGAGQSSPRCTMAGAGGTVEIEFAGQLLFSCTTVGAKLDQANWIRRKRNTVRHFARSSYAVGRQLELDQQMLESQRSHAGRLRGPRRRLPNLPRRHRMRRDDHRLRPAAAGRSQPRGHRHRRTPQRRHPTVGLGPPAPRSPSRLHLKQMSTATTLRITRRAADRLRAGHLWVYRTDLESSSTLATLEPGGSRNDH